MLNSRRGLRSRRALMERRLPPPAPRFPGKRWRSVEPVEMEFDEPDPLESLELEEEMEETSLLRKLPPRAPALPSRKIRLRRMSALQRRRLAASGGWLPATLSRAEMSLVSRVAATLEWNIQSAGAFAVALLEDVNAHEEAAAVNAIFSNP